MPRWRWSGCGAKNNDFVKNRLSEAVDSQRPPSWINQLYGIVPDPSYHPQNFIHWSSFHLTWQSLGKLCDELDEGQNIRCCLSSSVWPTYSHDWFALTLVDNISARIVCLLLALDMFFLWKDVFTFGVHRTRDSVHLVSLLSLLAVARKLCTPPVTVKIYPYEWVPCHACPSRFQYFWFIPRSSWRRRSWSDRVQNTKKKLNTNPLVV